MKSARKEKVNCPLLARQIPEEICTDALLVAEELHPERFADEQIRARANWQETCRNCPNNPYRGEA